ncbi:MAG: two-component regulator propeller domain-containing protein [Acidobacteriota bacterium]|nr:two-component regulator propeller domain-containing protein [Acidobacteriota bacterium]
MLNNWSSDQGLPQNSVVDLARTKDGYLWIGTQEGVSRFDGINFKTFKDPKFWAEQAIFTNVILAASDSSLWVGTREGLNQIKNEQFRTYTATSGLPGKYVTALAEDQSGTIWVGTRNGIAKITGEQITTITSKDGLIHDDIRNIAFTDDGSVWVGSDHGLSRIKDGKYEHFTEETGLTNNKITKLFVSRDGALWIGTEGGLNRFKDGLFSAYTIKNGLPNNSVYSLAEDAEGALWIGTGTGLSYLLNNQLVDYSKAVNALRDQIHSLLVDYEGILWIGTKSNGLYKLRKSKFKVYGEAEGVPRDDIWCVMESRDGSIWMGLGAGGGLARMKDGKVQSWSIKDGLPDSEVLALYETKSGDLWLGTGGGLCNFQNGRFNCLSTKNGLIDDKVTAISETSDGSLWIGTYNGVSRYKDGKFDNSWNQSGLGGNLIGDLLVSRDGSVWFAGMPNGLFRIKDQIVTSYSTTKGMPDQPTAIYEDAAGHFWIGTYQNGLCRMRPDGTITTYSTDQGLLENQVFDTVEDGLGYMWLTSNHGIFRLLKQQFDDLDEGKIPRLTPIRYGTSDGLRTEECNGGSQPSSWITRDGRVMITTIKGLVTFDPRLILDELTPPKVAINLIKANNVTIPVGQTIEIGPGLQSLEIHYTGLSLIAPKEIQFRYMLENWDKDWNNVYDRRTAYYTSLPPGDYTFKLSAANADGRWGQTFVATSIHVKKLFYQQFWFYFLCASLLGLATFGVYRFRVSSLNENLLDKIVRSMPIAMAVLDDKDSVKILNNQFTRDLGYTIEDVKNLKEWFGRAYPDPELRQRAITSWAKAASSTTPNEELRQISREWHVRCKNGAELDLEVRVARTLDRRIVTLNDITFRKHAEEALKNSREQLRELAARLQEAREEERAFIAREIHDELGQLLTGLKIDLKWFEKRLPQDADNFPMLKEKMASILELVDETIVAMRRVATQFRPGVLDTLGLIAAIEWQAEEFSNRTGIVCEFNEQLPQKLPKLECETALFRIFQESLTNVARHSDATAIKVSLTRKNGSLTLQIRDNGRGITEKEISDPHSIGLLGMRERAHIFGGEVKVSGLPGRGTTVIATIPIDHKSEKNNGHPASISKSA